MKKKLSVALRSPAVFAVIGVAASLAASGCGKSGSGGDGGGATAGTSSSGSGGSSNGGSSSGTGPDGGTSGDSSGATGGSGGTDPTGGAAGEPGGESSGGTGGAMGGTGGAGMGGAGGSGGGAAGMTGTLGENCSPRGALACAGNHQKLTILCGGDGTWQPNQTCGADQFCDSTPGPNVGTCQPIAPGCEDGPGSEPWCAEDDKQIIGCGPDAVTTANRACPRACHNGECRDDVGDCPVWDDYEVQRACSSDCAEPMPDPCTPYPEIGCLTAGVTAFPAVVRTPWADETCPATCSRMVINLYTSHAYLRVTASLPWSFESCQDGRQQCALLQPGSNELLIVYAPPDGVPSNVVLEEFETEPACPQ